MLLESYTLEIFNSECNPGAMTVMCHCPALESGSKKELSDYLSVFRVE